MKKIAFFFSFSVFLIAISCEKEIDNNAENPFGNQEVKDSNSTKLDIKTFEGLHQQIFAIKCANPTCHDGSFEPDFRTVQSAYSSLVYQPVTKNDSLNFYKYRVYPKKLNESWLMRRVLADEVLGRMPLYAQPLSDEEINAIQTWIMDGAPDAFGNKPAFPNLPPTIYGYHINDANGVRIDTNRPRWSSPFYLDANTNYTLRMFVEDDTSATADLTNHKMEMSYERDQWQPFASFTSFVKIWENVMDGSFSTSGISSGDTVYFRYYVADPAGAAIDEPQNSSPYWLKNHYSFIIK